MRAARKAIEAVFAAHLMPQIVARGLMWWKDDEIERWVGRTGSEVIAECVSDPKLQAVLAAQWGDHGGRPSEASFAVHAVVAVTTRRPLRVAEVRHALEWAAREGVPVATLARESAEAPNLTTLQRTGRARSGYASPTVPSSQQRRCA